MKIAKMTKTKLYQLTGMYSIYPLPLLKRTEIRHYKDTYWLEFYSKRKDDLSGIEKLVKVTYGRFCGENILRIHCKMDDYEKTFHPTDSELEELQNSIKTKRKEKR